MAQLTVADRMSPGFPGLVADSNMAKYVRSYVNAEVSAEIPFGVFVGRSASNSEAAVLLAAVTDDVLGVTVHSHAFHRNIEVGTIGMKPKVTMGVMRRGCIWVMCEVAATVDDPVFIRAVAAGAEVPGSVRIDADTADAFEAPWARFLTNTTGAGVIQVEFDILGSRVAAPVGP